MNKAIQNSTIRAIIAFIIVVLVMRNSFYTEQAHLFHALLSGLRFIGWILFLVLFAMNPKKIDGIGFWMLAYGVVIGYSTIVHHSDAPFTVISVGFDVLMLWGLFRLCRTTNTKYLLRIIIWSMCACIYLNFLLLLVFPNGIWTTAGGQSYFLLGGNYNQMGRTILPAIAVSGYYRTHYKGMRINFITLIVLSALTLLIVGSKTSLVGIMLMIVFYLLKSNRLRKWMFIGLIIGYIAFQTMVVFMQEDASESRYVTYFVEDVLQKDMTFTNRTYVWLNSLLLIEDSPVIGYGHQAAQWYTRQLTVTTTHNFILGQLVCGGFVGLSILICIIICAIRKALKHFTPASLFLLFGLLTFFFMMIMEVYPITYIFLLLLLLYNTKYFAPVASKSAKQSAKTEQKLETDNTQSNELKIETV